MHNMKFKEPLRQEQLERVVSIGRSLQDAWHQLNIKRARTTPNKKPTIKDFPDVIFPPFTLDERELKLKESGLEPCSLPSSSLLLIRSALQYPRLQQFIAQNPKMFNFPLAPAATIPQSVHEFDPPSIPLPVVSVQHEQPMISLTGLPQTLPPQQMETFLMLEEIASSDEDEVMPLTIVPTSSTSRLHHQQHNKQSSVSFLPTQLPTSRQVPVTLPSQGQVRVVRQDGATLRSEIDIDNSEVVCKLKCNEIHEYDDIQWLQPPEDDASVIPVQRVHIVGVLSGWASLTGRTVDDHAPLLQVIQRPSIAPAAEIIDLTLSQPDAVVVQMPSATTTSNAGVVLTSCPMCGFPVSSLVALDAHLAECLKDMI